MMLLLFRWCCAAICGLFCLTPAMARAAHPIHRDPLVIRDSGSLRSFEIATTELATGNTIKPLSLTLIPTIDSLDIRRRATALQFAANRPVRLVLYERGLPRNRSTRRILTRSVLVEIAATSDPAQLAKETTAIAFRTFQFAPNHVVLDFAGPADAALIAAPVLRARPDVISAEPLLGRNAAKRFTTDDPLFPQQWHFRKPENATAEGNLNLADVWDSHRGRNVTIAVIDDGLELGHPDLVDSIAAGLHYDFRDDDDDPSPTAPEDHHGTAVAGILAARVNNSIGVAGVAPEAALIAVRLIGGDDQTDEQSAHALAHQADIVDISNNSWGAPDSGQLLDGPGTLAALALKSGINDGRKGKGTLFVWSAGNGGELQDNANYDGFANSIYTIAVGGMTDAGEQPAYSEPGACIVVSAPSGPDAGEHAIVTTDLLGDEGLNFQGAFGDLDDRDYTQLFSGTSAAAPMVAGVIALMLEANPDLGWRDVQEILIRSARVVSKSDIDWTENGAGFHFNHKFGAGAVDAAAAVELAAEWKNLPPQTNYSTEATGLPIVIPDNNPLGVTLEFTAPALRVEHATVTFSAAHSARGDLAITLISPSGTRSRLAERHRDLNADFDEWTFMSTFNWGENSLGKWKLHVADLRASRTGRIAEARLQLYGTPLPSFEPVLAVPRLSERQFTFLLTAPVAGDYEVQSSIDLRTWTPLRQLTLHSGETVEITSDPGAAAQFFRAILR